MTDTPPNDAAGYPAVGTRLDGPSIADAARQAAQDAVGGARGPAGPSAPGAAPPPATGPSGASPGGAGVLGTLPEGLLTRGTGTIEHRFESRQAADALILNVDGARYRCSGSAPADTLVEAIDAHASGQDGRLMAVMRRLLLSVLLGDDRERYEARLAGSVVEIVDGDRLTTEPTATAPTGRALGEEVTLPPIDVVDLVAHGLWLVGTYFDDRPTQPSGSSAAGR